MTREEAIKWIEEHNKPYTDETKDSQVHRIAIKALQQPQIVRCKDCKHYKDGKCFYTMRRHGLKDDWFCADGEPKDGDTE